MYKLLKVMVMLMISFQALAGGLIGDYVIGPEPSDYNDMTSALIDVSILGMSGPVNFLVKPGDYDTHISIENIVRLGDADDRLTISSQDLNQPAVLFYDAMGSADNWVIQLNGIKYITFKDLILEAHGTSDFAKIIDIQSETAFINFENNVFNNYVPSVSANQFEVYSIFADNVINVSDISVSGNQFNSGGGAVFISGDTNNLIANLTVIDNQFNEQWATGSLYTFRVFNIDNLVFTSNELVNSQFNGKGITLFRIMGGLVDGNQISVLGIGTGNMGLSLSHFNTLSTESTVVSNNFIRASRLGLDIFSDNKRVKFYHNSIYVSDFNSLIPSHAIKISDNDNEDLELINNMFLSNNDVALGQVMEIEDGTEVLESNFNVFHGMPMMTFQFRVNGNDYPAFADYQASTPFDGQSIDKAINFIDSASGDLHLALNQYPDPDIKVNPLADVFNDIDDELRSTVSVLIGADDLNHDVIFVDGFE